MSDVQLATKGDHVIDQQLARSTCAAVASLADLTIDRIAEAQRAVGDCVALFGGAPVEVTFRHSSQRVEMDVRGPRIADHLADALCVQLPSATHSSTTETTTIHISCEGGTS